MDITVPIEWRSMETIDRSVSTVFNRKVGGKSIGSYGNFGKMADNLLNFDF